MSYNEQYHFQQQPPQQQQQQQDYWIPDQNQYAGFEQGQADSSYNFEMPVQQDFGKELDFQTFDVNAVTAVNAAQQSSNMYGVNPYLNVGDGGYYQPTDASAAAGGKFDDFEDEPPLLEELGINLDFILQKHVIRSGNDWAGRFWARTFCDSTTMHCQTGDCGNQLQCNGTAGAYPATQVEIILRGANNGLDYYAISLVNGYNVKATIEPVNGRGYCRTVKCTGDINNVCPAELKQIGGVRGEFNVACNSACSKYNTDKYCCRELYGHPNTCRPNTWQVNSAAVFKRACPDAYSYAYDSDAATLCLSERYRITFDQP